jgi:hypothetical protein
MASFTFWTVGSVCPSVIYDPRWRHKVRITAGWTHGVRLGMKHVHDVKTLPNPPLTLKGIPEPQLVWEVVA